MTLSKNGLLINDESQEASAQRSSAGMSEIASIFCPAVVIARL